ncbi:4-amino-4-deoxy-L-arabinose transferase [Bryocella elongata]|uniref:4-amino-4-deoxy-L-arabinose transferase n=1 Tax=Bryocella elongata TaxID=863522 RepID=A0A1H5YAW4_9BACT|nr:phospholipid carrier-dependent glycosyltransferase [Bryocella elongata]SEG20750.1 4-amino-4-deoxy-L-arabinose transferase [Bryocella elongata]
MTRTLARPRSTLLCVIAAWLAFYASFTLFTPALLDDADSVHVEVAREMLMRESGVTLYANGIRYLEKAPLLYWSMAASMRVAETLGLHSPRALVAFARLPLALTVLALALLAEAFARRLFRRVYAGLYAALILLSSFGIFIFTRITIPDAMVCLWLAMALYFFWLLERIALNPQLLDPARHPRAHRHSCYGFAIACALNVLTKGLIGLVFPVAIATIYLLLTRGLKRSLRRIRDFHLARSFTVFLLIAAPWHILAALANPGQGHPEPFRFVTEYIFPFHFGHWIVPLPTDGNVRGWAWFYFMNEHLLRYLNLRVPHDYDTVPLVLFLGLCFVWMMPWSAFLPQTVRWALPVHSAKWRSQLRRHDLPLKQRGQLLLVIWAAFVLFFFSFSTRQEYYVLPALPALAILIAGWLATVQAQRAECESKGLRDPARMPLLILAALGALFTAVTVYLLLHTRQPAPGTDLSDLLSQNPGEYALSFGHFLDLDMRALGMFRVPLVLAACGLLLGPVMALMLRRRKHPHTATLLLSAGAFTFLLAAHLGLRTFAPVLSSAQLAEAIQKQLQPDDVVIIHGEYEAGSTLGFYLERPRSYGRANFASGDGTGPHLRAIAPIGIYEGRSSNLWYGSFFPDAPHIFPSHEDLEGLWSGPHRIFMWQSLTDPPNQLPSGISPVYVIARSGGKEIVSNRPNR